MKRKLIISVLATVVLLFNVSSGNVNVYAEEGGENDSTEIVTGSVDTNQKSNVDALNETVQNITFDAVPESKEKTTVTTGQAIVIKDEQAEKSVAEEVYEPAQYIINVEAIDTEGNTINSYQLIKEGKGVYDIQPGVIDGYKAVSETMIVELTEENRVAAIFIIYEKKVPKVRFRERVFDLANNKGLEAVLITFMNKESNKETVCLTDSGGFFEAELEVGDYSLKLTKRGFKDKIIDLEIK